MTLSSVSESPDLAFFALLPLGSAARAAGDQGPKAQVPTSAAQRRSLDRIENDLHVGVGDTSLYYRCLWLFDKRLSRSFTLTVRL